MKLATNDLHFRFGDPILALGIIARNDFHGTQGYNLASPWRARLITDDRLIWTWVAVIVSMFIIKTKKRTTQRATGLIFPHQAETAITTSLASSAFSYSSKAGNFTIVCLA